jgi:hypothetical protein
MRRRTVTCGRKEKQENEIGENLSLEKRKKEKRPARRKNSPEMKDNSQDRLRQIYLSAHTHVSNILFLGSKPQLRSEKIKCILEHVTYA